MDGIVDVTPEVAPVAEPGTVTPAVTQNYFGADGTLNEGWKSTLPEGYRDEKSLPDSGNAKVIAKMFVDTKRMVGKNTMVRPNENSPIDDWSDYYEAGGRPHTADEYALAPPEGFPPELAEQVFPADLVGKWQQRFFDGGVSKKTADQLVAEFANDQIAAYQSQLQQEQMAIEKLTTELSQDWGAAYDQNIHLGNIAIEEGVDGNAEFKSRVVAKIQNDPDLTRFTSNLGKKFAEGKSPDFTAIPTPSDMQTEINKLEQDPLYLNGTQKQRMEIASKIMAIRNKMTKGATIS